MTYLARYKISAFQCVDGDTVPYEIFEDQTIDTEDWSRANKMVEDHIEKLKKDLPNSFLKERLFLPRVTLDSLTFLITEFSYRDQATDD